MQGLSGHVRAQARSGHLDGLDTTTLQSTGRGRMCRGPPFRRDRLSDIRIPA